LLTGLKVSKWSKMPDCPATGTKPVFIVKTAKGYFKKSGEYWHG